MIPRIRSFSLVGRFTMGRGFIITWGRRTIEIRFSVRIPGQPGDAR